MENVQRNDFLQFVRKASFTLPDALPLAGRSGETRLQGLQNGKAEKQILTSSMWGTAIDGTFASGLAVHADLLEFRDFPAVTLTYTLKTVGEISVGHSALFRHEFCGMNPVLYNEKGETLEIRKFPPHPPRDGQMPPPPPQHQRPPMPPKPEGSLYFLSFADCTVVIKCEEYPVFFRETPAGVSADIPLFPGMLPAMGESKEYAPITVLVFEGGLERAKELSASFFEIHG